MLAERGVRGSGKERYKRKRGRRVVRCQRERG
jgi:hypothetical protein